ncbi:LacI family DNA-binding transcriptional regulator [Cryptosporangium minutisporangium]|uniref:LacI family DNA-binding transcriptional regulator n=1 Tax=Cryptosporangium minutisporangium TaxID=113569 RepID=A0ABP6T271_9ACTN
MVTMRQVAEHAGVSAKTVSRVVNKDRYVSDDVRRRVEEAIAELQYTPNMLARTFRFGRDPAIGVAVPDISDPFFAAVTHTVEQVARSRGVATFVTSLGTDGTLERAGVEALLGRQIAGLISTPVSADQSYLEPWKSRTALVFIDRPPRRLTADTVVEDDVGGAHAATTHLAGHGHRRIAYIGDEVQIATTRRRLEGYRAALGDAGIEPDEGLIRFAGAGGVAAGEDAAALLAGPNPPTAILSSNAKCSIAIVPALQRLDRTDVALVSFGDFPLASSLRPALTVVDQNPEALGRFAATRLFDRIDQPGRRLRRLTVLPVRLVERESCGTLHPAI